MGPQPLHRREQRCVRPQVHCQERRCCPRSVQHGPRRSPCCGRHPLRTYPRLQRRDLHQQCWPEGCLLNPVDTPPPSRQLYSSVSRVTSYSIMFGLRDIHPATQSIIVPAEYLLLINFQKKKKKKKKKKS